MHDISAETVAAWMDAFARAVRDRDLDAGRALFEATATGFGTVATRYDGLDDLVENQWSDVWSRTTDFTFDDVTASWTDQVLCAVAASWRSVGDDRVRTGRATLVLRQTEDGLRCVHTHFSMTPGTTA